jgi:hypothetical protein
MIKPHHRNIGIIGTGSAGGYLDRLLQEIGAGTMGPPFEPFRANRNFL